MWSLRNHVNDINLSDSLSTTIGQCQFLKMDQLIFLFFYFFGWVGIGPRKRIEENE